MTWVWKYNEESRLQIGASSDCANICSRATFHARPNSPFTRPWSAQFCSWPKGRRTNCSYLRGRFSEQYAARKFYLQEEIQPRLDKEFNSPNALNVTMTSRLRYAGHMIGRLEDLPQKALFRAKPNGRRNQGRPKCRWADGVSSDTLALWVSDWTHCAQDMERSSPTGLNQILVVVPQK
jgi:hypothetical protein